MSDDEAEALLQQATAAHAAGRLAEAAGLYRAVLQEHDEAAAVWHLLGAALLAHGDTEEAVPALRRATELAPREADFHCDLGKALRVAGHPAESLHAFMTALQLAPRHASAHAAHGNALKVLGRPAEAETAYRQALLHGGPDADVHSNLGVTLRALGREAEAIAQYREALACKREHPAAHLNLARALAATGCREESLAHYRQAAAAAPADAALQRDVAHALFDAGLHEEALVRCERVLSLAPHAREHGLLQARILRALDRAADAERVLRGVLERHPGYFDACNELAITLRDLRREQEALELLRALAEAHPDSAVIHYNTGNVLQECGCEDDALAAYRQAVAVRADFAPAYNAQVVLLRARGENEAARAVSDAWLRAVPDDAVAAHRLASLAGGAAPERASDAFVRSEFDAFAAGFDRKLADLDYRAPALLEGAIRRHAGEAAGRLDVLDAGCGTGLCGPLLQPWARRLVGVDLSPGMLARARRRGAYDALVEAELVAFMRSHERCFDLVACVDTLCYFGALDAPLGAVRGALRPGGVFAFTVELLAADAAGAAGLVLHSHGRYAHCEAHVRGALAGAGLACASLDEAWLRMESGARVSGLVVIARAP